MPRCLILLWSLALAGCATPARLCPGQPATGWGQKIFFTGTVFPAIRLFLAVLPICARLLRSPKCRNPRQRAAAGAQP